ncbi:hypothetical protein ACQRDX_08645, partial [Streptococcus sp. SGI.013]|uniref:hypothetical protein n=1 Tax=unclassified Streptococcus TaxID=2608887 RepID=UPI003D01B5AC
VKRRLKGLLFCLSYKISLLLSLVGVFLNKRSFSDSRFRVELKVTSMTLVVFYVIYSNSNLYSKRLHNLFYSGKSTIMEPRYKEEKIFAVWMQWTKG